MIRYERVKWPRRYSIVLEGITYLTRVLLVWWRECPVRLFLHRIHRPDSGRYPHNHPWDWAYSLILWGGYWETVTDGVISWVEYHGPLSLSWRAFRPGCYHRITRVKPNTWTLFLAGRKSRQWGFLEGNRFVPSVDQGLDD